MVPNFPLPTPKGRGTQLKDIPNVAYKLSKRKPDDNLQILHSILYGKRTKAHNLKKNIGQFSGYVWVENEQEKHRSKVKEKLDKCVKEKLLVFCDILNIPVSRSAAKKDELSVKLVDFLESPHSTTDSLLADKEQKSKKLKRKGTTSKSKGSLDKATGKSAKQKSEVGKKRKQSEEMEEEEADDEPSNTRDESGDDNDDEEAHVVGSDEEESGSEKGEEEEVEEEPKKSNGKISLKEDSGRKAKEKPKAVKKDNPAKEVGSDNDDEEAHEVGSDQEESGSEEKEEEEEEEEEEKPKIKKSNGMISSKKDSRKKATEKSKAEKKDTPAKSPKSSKISSKVSSSKASKRGASSADSLAESKKQKVEKKSQKEENDSNKKQSTKSPAKVSEKEGKGKSAKKAKTDPSNEEIHAAAVNILKEVDFNSATLSDIIRKLGSHFGVDLMHKKAEVKAIITDVINNMSDEEEGDDPEAGDDEEKNDSDA
ncbi:DEK domain-containing chromatin-associated protein 1-like isoform X5 [Nicotiana tomentosiformis]|uniref:DEK domain-containing chromatin-associated protein 1-like isoform X5 n=1 Tax=Nicotiana tomentosiformis TaxID=4098 RepID=UPI001446AA89|nr:ABC transporter F family member 4-like isoform X4 [Nicotiana tomentosiformis]